MTDPHRVRQIIDGLAENALRVTPAGRPVLLGLYETPGPPSCRSATAARGCPRRTCRSPSSARSCTSATAESGRSGTGVGLALVHGLTTRLGGTADAGRAPEGGACFTVSFPVTRR